MSELVGMAGVIVVPVLPTAFGQGSTSAFLGQLAELKSIRRSMKRVAIPRNRACLGTLGQSRDLRRRRRHA